MRLEFDFSSFKDAVEWAARALDSTPTDVAMSGIRITVTESQLGQARVFGMGADNSASCLLSVATAEPVDLVIQGALLREIVRVVKKADLIVLQADEADGDTESARFSKVRVGVGKASYRVPVLPLKNYPPSPQFPAGFGEVKTEDLVKAIKRVEGAAAGDGGALPALMAISLTADPKTQTLTLVTTDWYRLAVATVPYRPLGDEMEASTVLVPAKALGKHVRSFTNSLVTLCASDGSYGLKSGVVDLTGRLLAGSFPDWRRAVPDPEAAAMKIPLPSEALDECLKRVSLVSSNDNNKVSLRIANNAVTVTAGSAGFATAEDSIEVAYDGEAFEASYNAQYLETALRGAGGEDVVLHATTPAAAVLLMPAEVAADDLYKAVVMPVKA